jgi:hypothetical protein
MAPLVIALVILLGSAPARAADPLAEARRLYNAGQFQAAEKLAREAMTVPALGDAARVVLGRVLLERFRESSNAEDLSTARKALIAVDPRALDARERVELTIGLGESLYLEDRFGAAAEVFASVLDRSAQLGPAAHERVLDWWATALDRQTQLRPPEDRPSVYERLLERMRREIADDPGSTAANYWLAAAARGTGDLELAWQASAAGWVRAVLAQDRGTALRADLDRLVTQAIIPERAARLAGRETRQAQSGMLTEWQLLKETWSK